MNKSESYKIVKRIFEKHAGIGGDVIRNTVGDIGLASGLAFANQPEAAITLIPAGELAGGLHGVFAKTPNIDDVNKMENRIGRSFLPGMALSRAIRRRRALKGALKDNPGYFNLPLSELSGIATSLVAPTYALGGAGSLISPTAGAYGFDGGMAASVLGNAAAPVLAMLTRRRTLEEQAKVDNSKTRAVLRHIIPGLAMYDLWKGLGATRNLVGNTDAIQAELERIREKRQNR